MGIPNVSFNVMLIFQAAIKIVTIYRMNLQEVKNSIKWNEKEVYYDKF